MEKQMNAKGQGSYLRSALFGVVGVVLFLGLLLLAAALSDTRSEIMELKTPIVKACLLISAFVCGALAASKAEQAKLPQALIAEGALLVVLLISAAVKNSEIQILSFFIDVLLMLFGAFAGTILKKKRGIKRRGKR